MRKPPSFRGKRDPKTDADWDELAECLGVESGAVLKDQIRLADEVILDVLAEEKENEA